MKAEIVNSVERTKTSSSTARQINEKSHGTFIELFDGW
jgi:hypothetical protein